MERTAVVAIVVVLALAVPTVAVTASEDDAGGITMSPYDGPGGNGQYAYLDGGEIHVSFEELNDDAVTTADRVFNVTSEADCNVRVWVEVQNVTAYRGDHPANEIDDESEAVVLSPGETISVGFRIDTTGAVPDPDEMTIHAEGTDDCGDGEGPTDEPDTPTDTPETPTDMPDTPTETPDTPTDTPDTPTDTPDTPTDTPDTPTEEPPGDGPSFRVVGISVDDREVVAGNETTVTVRVKNVGNEAGSYTVRLRVEGQVVATQTVSLGSGETRTVTFVHSFDQSGTYELAVGEEESRQRVTVEVVDPGEPRADIAVTDVAVADRSISPGENTAITATVENTGNESGEVTLKLVVAGTVVDTVTVEVPAGETVTVRFERQFAEAGVYPVAVNGVAGNDVVVSANDVLGDRLYRGSLSIVGGVPLVLGLLLALRRRRD